LFCMDSTSSVAATNGNGTIATLYSSDWLITLTLLKHRLPTRFGFSFVFCFICRKHGNKIKYQHGGAFTVQCPLLVRRMCLSWDSRGSIPSSLRERDIREWEHQQQCTPGTECVYEYATPPPRGVQCASFFKLANHRHCVIVAWLLCHRTS